MKRTETTEGGHSCPPRKVGTIPTEIGTIAADWRIAPLDAVCEPPQYGFTASAEAKGKVRFLRITDITDSGVKWPTVPFCECPEEELGKYRLASGDIVFARIGATTGKSYLITNPPPSVFASYLIRVRTKREIDPIFLSQFFRSDAYWRQVDAQKNANLKKGVSGSLLKTLLVPVPPLSEQRKIAGVLGVVQRAMEQQERLLALTAELKKALLHKLFTEGLRGEPKKQTDIGPVPQSWELVKLDDVFETQLGKMLSQKAHIGNDPKPYLRNKNVQWGQIDITDLLEMNFNERERAKFALRPGDLLICEGGEPGRAAIWHGELKECYYQKALHRLRPKDQRITNEYLAHWLAFSLQLQNLYGVAGASSTIAHLPESQLKALPIPMPKRSEQDEICVTLEGVVSKVAHHRRKHATLASLFHTLLYQLMSAQIRVHDLDMDKLECILERGDVSPLSEGVTRRADQSADSSAHSEKQNGDTSPHVTIRKVE